MKKTLTSAAAVAGLLASSAQANVLSYDFNDGTMQGWTNVMFSKASDGYYDTQFGPAQTYGRDGWGGGSNADAHVTGYTAHNGNDIATTYGVNVGAYFLSTTPWEATKGTTDWATYPAPVSGVHKSLMVQSPWFVFDGSGPLSYVGAGGSIAGGPILTSASAIPVIAGSWGPEAYKVGAGPTNSSGNNYPAVSTKGNGQVSIMRDDGVFVLSKQFTQGNWTTYTWSAAELQDFANNGRSYSLVMVDWLAGQSANYALDNISIPAKLLSDMPFMPSPLLQISCCATNSSKLNIRWSPTINGKTQTLISSEDLKTPTADWTVIQAATTTEWATSVLLDVPTRSTFYALRSEPVYGQNVQVTSAPGNASSFAGDSVALSVTATGSLLKYQWYKGSNLLSGQTNSALILSNLSTNDAGTYSVIVSGALGNPVTNSAVLVVHLPGTMNILNPVKFYNVTLNDPFWSRRISTQVNITMPQWFNRFRNEGIYNNWAKAGNVMGGNFQGYIFSEIDAAMSLQGMLRANKYVFNPTIDSQLQTVFSYIKAAQDFRGDGYINFYVQLGLAGRNGDYNGKTPWSDLISQHEHLVAGDLFWVGLDDYELFGRTNMLKTACRFADHMSATFGPSPKTSGVGGHEGCEVPLLLMSELPVWGKQSYYDQSKFYIEERGRHSGGRQIYGEYCQDLHELKNETEPYGHAVRGPYHWESAAHLCRTTGDTNLIARLETLWDNVVNKKMYVTGGIGHKECNEGFSVDYDLDNEMSYCESCATCAMMFWGREMGNLLGNGKYNDNVEWQLYNNFGSAQCLDGSRIYYRNYVKRTKQEGRTGIECCFGNVSRTIPDVPGYQYSTRSSDGIWTHLYMAGQGRLTYNATNVTITQTTLYPWDSAVTMSVAVSNATAFTMHLRSAFLA